MNDTAKWTRKDYQACAEDLGVTLLRLRQHDKKLPILYIGDILIEAAADTCEAHAALDRNGNRNFERDLFIREVWRQAGLEWAYDLISGSS